MIRKFVEKPIRRVKDVAEAVPVAQAGAKTLEQARSACARTRSFSGGPVTLTQYASGGFDADYRCP